MRNHAVLCTRPDETHRPDPLGAASTPQCLSARGLYTYGGYVIDRYVRYTLSSFRAAGFVLADQVLKSTHTDQTEFTPKDAPNDAKPCTAEA